MFSFPLSSSSETVFCYYLPLDVKLPYTEIGGCKCFEKGCLIGKLTQSIKCSLDGSLPTKLRDTTVGTPVRAEVSGHLIADKNFLMYECSVPVIGEV